MRKVICHMTHINNLQSIISTGLLCKNNNPGQYINIANENVQDKRSKKTVPLSKGGTLHDYVPFYFWGVTPMLYAHKECQEDIIFLVSHTDTIEQSGQSYIFTDRHAITSYAKFYDNLAHLNELDWHTIESRWWKDPKDPAKQEKNRLNFWFLTRFPWNY